LLFKKKDHQDEVNKFIDHSCRVIAKKLKEKELKSEKFRKKYGMDEKPNFLFEADMKKLLEIAKNSSGKHKARLVSELSIINQEKDTERANILSGIASYLAFLDQELSMRSIKIPIDFNHYDPLAFMRELYERLQAEFI